MARLPEVLIDRTGVLERLLRDRKAPPPPERAEELERVAAAESPERELARIWGIDELELARLIAEAYDIPCLDLLDHTKIDPQVMVLVPRELAARLRLVPLFEVNGRLIVAVSSPRTLALLPCLSTELGLPLDPVAAPETQIEQAIDRFYKAVDEFGGGGEVAAALPPLEEALYRLDREPAEGEGGAVRLVDLILSQAIDDGSSDVHLDPTEEGLVLRFRVAGLLRDLRSFPPQMSAGVVSRIKILAGLDIAERRLPQDGRIALAYRGREIDLRVSSLPTVGGEKLVLRILDKSKAITGLGVLGFLPETEEVFRQAIASAYGIVLITGPTGSGKTTTLYSALNEINSRDMNIVTLEDPVEYRLRGINQTQVNPRAGLTFASGLRASLRQDPDVIMVGEIRDLETAETAVHAALTGHLVFSTLHTNDASSTLVRLVDMGIEPFLISTSLVGVAAQRLVRRLCVHCREGSPADPKLRRRLGIASIPGEAQVFRGRGCLECDGTGFRGQTGIYELMPIEDTMRALIAENAPAAALRREARKLGMITLREDGVIKVLQGITSWEEVLRVTSDVV